MKLLSLRFILLFLTLLLCSTYVSSDCVSLVGQYDLNVKICASTDSDCHANLMRTGLSLGNECYSHGRYDEAFSYYEHVNHQFSFLDENRVKEITKTSSYFDSLIVVDLNRYDIAKVRYELIMLTSDSNNKSLLERKQEYYSVVQETTSDYFNAGTLVLCKNNSLCAKSVIPRFNSNALSNTELSLAENYLYSAFTYSLILNDLGPNESTKIIGLYYFRAFEEKQKVVVNEFIGTILDISSKSLLESTLLNLLLAVTVIVVIGFIILRFYDNIFNKNLSQKVPVVVSLTNLIRFIKENNISRVSEIRLDSIIAIWAAVTVSFSLIISYIGTIEGAFSGDNSLAIAAVITYIRTYPIFQLTTVFLILFGLMTFLFIILILLKIMRKVSSAQIIQGATFFFVLEFLLIWAAYSAIIFSLIYVLALLSFFNLYLLTAIMALSLATPVVIIYVTLLFTIIRKLSLLFADLIFALLQIFIAFLFTLIGFGLSLFETVKDSFKNVVKKQEKVSVSKKVKKSRPGQVKH